LTGPRTDVTGPHSRPRPWLPDYDNGMRRISDYRPTAWSCAQKRAGPLALGPSA